MNYEFHPAAEAEFLAFAHDRRRPYYWLDRLQQPTSHD
jgi:hypothetical protein